MTHEALYSVPVATLDGTPTNLENYRGKVLLIVNVASKCGFTPQYAGLEELAQHFRPRGFEVLAFPCNQFGGQEPGSAEEIRNFCSTTYPVTFPIFAKVDVNGPTAHPLFTLLKEAAPGLLGTEAIKWNFTKFLVNRSGREIRRYAPSTAPTALFDEIEQQLLAEPWVE